VKNRSFAHYAAPIAFLVAVTIVVLIVHSALNGGNHAGAPTTTTTQTSTSFKVFHHHHHRKAHGGKLTYTVRSGDTFGSIAQKEGTTVAHLEHLNPHVNPNALQVGQKIRVR
jgi:LysM repeat protein